jgi:hypothetical protein
MSTPEQGLAKALIKPIPEPKRHEIDLNAMAFLPRKRPCVRLIRR